MGIPWRYMYGQITVNAGNIRKGQLYKQFLQAMRCADHETVALMLGSDRDWETHYFTAP